MYTNWACIPTFIKECKYENNEQQNEYYACAGFAQTFMPCHVVNDGDNVFVFPAS